MKKFCVIGEAGPITGLRRSWFETEEGAVEHATNLVRTQYRKQGNPLGLYVVEIKKAVEIGLPPVEVRDVTDEDMTEFE